MHAALRRVRTADERLFGGGEHTDDMRYEINHSRRSCEAGKKKG
jgi:hypothetical protein